MEGGGAMIQVYTGNGKGKTTAALGLALRCAGAGKKVFFGQFIKGKDYSELLALKKLKITCEQFGRGCFIRTKPQDADINCAQKGLLRLSRIISSGKFDLVILDEVNIAVKLGLLRCSDILALIKKTPARTELVLTGRGCLPQIKKAADLVSEVREIKHYYRKGIKARRGFEY
jgi:cob(I)alamin adenosyltransferase